jgi:chromate reductase, NAD(P)H dehydrogenase (quinone)
MKKNFKILGFAGSLRKDSYNKALLRAALELLPEGAELEIFDLEGIPFFNQDLENEPVEKLKEFKTKIRAADAILIATPEYNYSIPGVLKNAIDCASRPHGDNAFAHKPVAIMGASPGMLGTARAQFDLRHCFIFLSCFALGQPEVLVSFAHEKIDKNGKVIDQKTRGLIKELLENLVTLSIKLSFTAKI